MDESEGLEEKTVRAQPERNPGVGGLLPDRQGRPETGDKLPSNIQDISSDATVQKAEEDRENVAGNFGAVSFTDNLEILIDKRLPHLDTGPAKAYEVTSKGRLAGDNFALVCERHLIPRARAASVFSTFINPSLLKLVHFGVTDWPPSKSRHYAFVYEKPQGKPLIRRSERQALGIKHDLVLEHIVKPMVGLLKDFRNKDFVHGNIRADNIFRFGESSIETIILGDCLALPPSYMQPVLYEPIERAMADPVAKGLGSKEDDIYAFGVMLAVILRHNDPLEGLSADEIIRQKVEHGTYAAVTGKDRFTGPVLELLRGLLYDEPDQRWTVDEIEDWLDGQRLSPKQIPKRVKAARPITFNGAKYLRPSVLAMRLQDNIAEAVQLVENGDLGLWLERSLEIKEADEIIERSSKAAEENGRGSGYKDRLISRVSVFLDPEAPVRIKGLNMRPEGIGYSLVEAIIFNRDIQPYVEIITSQLILFWLEWQKPNRVDSSALTGRFESCRAYVRQKNMGYGIERCLYILCPECPCLSDKLKDYYVLTPEDLMKAFEDMCNKGNVPVNFLDRHIVAFLSYKDRNVVDPYFVEINSSDKHDQLIGCIRTLAVIQTRGRMEKFPAITNALAGMLEPVYERFHDRDLRASLNKRVNEIKNLGDINKIKELIDNSELSNKDYRGYRNASIEYNELKKEKKNLEEKMRQEGEFGKSTGRQFAALVSGFLAGIIITLFAIFAYSGIGG
jgi:hypothetical protein